MHCNISIVVDMNRLNRFNYSAFFVVVCCVRRTMDLRDKDSLTFEMLKPLLLNCSGTANGIRFVGI